MEKEILFAKTLEQIKNIAKEQGNCISEKRVKEAFVDLDLQEEQLEMVYEYLKKYKIGIGEPVDMDDYLTDGEKDYIGTYLEELGLLEELSEGEKQAVIIGAMAQDTKAQNKLIELYLPYVVDLAKLYAGQGVYLEDLIGEGNLTLSLGVKMLGCLERSEEAEGMLGKMMMDAMEAYIEENAEESKKDKRIADSVNKVAAAATELAESLGRKVTVEELAEETGMSLKIIQNAIRMSGDRIEDLEAGEHN